MRKRSSIVARSARAASAFLRGETLRAALILSALLVAFFWTPLSRYDEAYYSSADLLQDFSLTRIVPGYPAGNKLMSDEVTEMHPWALFNRDELRQGRIPWWNPWNGAGCPHVANYQSAVFSLFTLPWYFLSTKAALLSTAFMKLFLCGFFTFLFLKKLRLGFVAALVGATAFMFGGHNILLLSFPHVGAQVVLPAALYYAECVLQRFERWAGSFLVETGGPGSAGPFAPDVTARSAEVAVDAVDPRVQPSLRGPLVGLAITFALGLLAGQPEVFYFSFALVAAFIAVRLLTVAKRTRAAQGAWPRLFAVAGKFCFAGLVGAGLAAFQLLPFFEFLENSRLYEQRSLTQTPLSTEYWSLSMFPNVIGNPSLPYNLAFSVPSPNYELVNMAYIGGLVVFLALIASLFAFRDRRILFFGAAATAWLFYAYDLFGAARLFAMIPTVDIAPMNRSQGLWLFCVAVLAALAVDHLMRDVVRRKALLSLTILGAALVFLTTLLIGADRLIDAYSTFESPNHSRFSLFVPAHVSTMCALFGIGVFSVLACVLVRERVVRTGFGLVILTSTFLASGWLLRDYNPCTENEFFYPVTPALRELMANVGDQRIAVLGEDKLPPDVNLPYRLQSIDNYDGMWVQKVDYLYRDQFGDTHNWRPIIKASEHALKLFAVQFVLAKWGWNFVDSGFNPLHRAAGQKYIRHEIVPGGSATQTITVHRPGLSAIALHLSANINARGTHLDFKLEDLDANQIVAAQTLTVEEVRSTLFTGGQYPFPTDIRTEPIGRYVVFRFPSLDSRGKHYKITLSSTDGRDGNCVYAWSAPLLAYGEGQATWRDKPLKGELLFDFARNADDFETVAQIGDYVLYRYKDAVPMCMLVRGAVVVENDAEALAMLRLASFDPSQIVILSDDETLPPEVRAQLGPVSNAARRLVKFEGDDKIYVVEEAKHRLVHVQNEVVFLINKFDWKKVETVTTDEFAGWPRTFEDIQAQMEAGLRVITPEVKGASSLRIVEQTPTKIVMEVDRLWPSYVVISQSWFPGWRAYVDGAEVPVWRANYAFDAIAAPAGRSTIEFVYEPASRRIGAWISLVALLLGLIGLRHGTRAFRIA